MKHARPVRLAWEGKTAALAAPAAAAAPAATTLEHAAGRLVHGDNLAVLDGLAGEFEGKVTLAYLDPPFLTGRVLEGRVAAARGEGAEAGAAAGGAVPKPPRSGRTLRAAFDDRWDDRAAYLEALGRRLVAVRRLLAPHGSVVVHVDPKTSHYVKVLCDEIFGDDAFASEIVWRYRRWPSRTPNFQRVHDVLLRYRKDPTAPPRFVQAYEPLAASTLATWGTAKQRAVVGEGGKRARSSKTAEATPGVPLGDVWEISVIAPVARERTGYPTQKPEALLERLVTTLSAPGDVVLDPYAGSGTTLAVAARLGRPFVGVDASEVAVETARARLAAQGVALVSRCPGAAPAHTLSA